MNFLLLNLLVYDYYSNVLDSLQGKAKALCDGYEGLKSLEIIIAAYESSKSGESKKLMLNKNF